MKQEPVGNRFFCYLLTACGLLLFLDGCSRDISSASYDEASVGETRDAYPCIVEHVRRVKVGINMKEARLGMLGGAAVGGGLGHLIGQGRGGKGFATVGGGILGGVVGSALEKGLTDQDGLEYRVRLLSTGAIKIVVQGFDAPLHVGERALLIVGASGRSRLVRNGSFF